VLFRRPVREVAKWPAWEVRLLEEFLRREPDPGTRIEYTLAGFAANYFNSHARAGSPRLKLTDFLLFDQAWSKEFDEASFSSDRYSDLDREIFSNLGRS
jgi:hypothetical protein